ncbi:MAG: hypothetical protein ACREOS_12140, partial [Candidatus Dormibacteraceae bacterium]
GPNYLVEAVNSSMSIWTKDGALVSAQDLNLFFLVLSGYGFSDPRVLYDSITSRWLLSGFAFNPAGDSVAYLALSASPDPTGAWYEYKIASNSSAILYDQPMTGVTADKVVVSWNDYSTLTTFTGSETYVMQESDLDAGTPAAYTRFGPDATRFRVVPAQSLTATTTEWMVYNTLQATIGVIAITGTPLLGNVTLSEYDPAAAGITVPPQALQPSGTPALDTGDGRLTFAAWQGGELWTGATESCVPGGDTSSRSCLRIFQVNAPTDGSRATVLQDFDIGIDGAYLLYPAIAPDQYGDAFIVATESSVASYPSVVGFDQLAGIGAKTVEGPYLETGGAGSYTCGCAGLGGGPNRWGDYSAAALDPANPSYVWLTGEYMASATDPFDWGTATTEVRAPSVFNPLTPVRVLDTRAPQCTGANPCSPFGPNSTRTLQVAGRNGVPSSATAVALNVGVTDSRGASSSYIELWPAGEPQPNASTLNFVAGQTIANMTQVPVGASGAIDIFNSVGYVDVFIDLSGYYAPGPASGPGLYHPLAAPVRYLDTRQSWDPTRTSPLGPGEIISLGIAGARPAECVPTPALCSAGVPVPSTATAVVMNLAEVTATANSYLQVWPAGSAPPVTSNLNFPGGRFALANRVIVPVDPTTGEVSILNSQGFANVLVDVVGYITGSVSDTGDRFVPATPYRVTDTRNGQGLAGGVPARLGPNAADVVAVSGLPADAHAVAVSIGVLNASTYSYLALLPNSPVSPPTTSDVNFQVGDILASSDLVRITGGQFWAYNSAGSADFFVDVSGVYVGS